MAKPFMNYDEQIQKLQDKHLIIEDVEAAKSVLRQDRYFALVTGYKDLFKNLTTKNYRDGTTLDDIVALYRFDEALREITLRYLLHIEQHIRAGLSYAFCDKYGDNQSTYMDAANYDTSTKRNLFQVNRLIKKYIEPELTAPSRHTYIEHHKTAHHNVPLWVLVSALPFGSLSKMYEFSKPSIKAAISCEFEGINESQLGQILNVLTDYRNLCAHNERMFSYRCPKKDIPDLTLHQKLNIPQKGNTYQLGKRDYFSVVLSFRYLLSHKDFSRYKMQLTGLIEKEVKENLKISETDLLGIMGFPTNWKKISSYKKI